MIALDSPKTRYWLDQAAALTRKLTDSVYRWRWAWAVSLFSFIVLTQFYSIGINASDSLPDHVFLLRKNDRGFHRNDYISFRWHGGGPYGAGVTFTKIVKGLPGDRVTFRGRDVYVNDEYIGTAKERAKTGQKLALGPDGVIPEGHYFVYAPNSDSLDSRYALTGWISQNAVRGRPVPLF